MNEQVKSFVSVEEQARRRKLVEKSHWHNIMEGLGEPHPERIKIDELWIAGQITHEERGQRIDRNLKQYLASRSA